MPAHLLGTVPILMRRLLDRQLRGPLLVLLRTRQLVMHPVDPLGAVSAAFW